MLNFDEFRAVSKRDRSKLLSVEFTGAETKKDPKVHSFSTTEKTQSKKIIDGNFEDSDSNSEKQSVFTTGLRTVGEFLELHLVQGIYIFLLLMDTFAALSEVYLNQLLNKKFLLVLTKSSLLKAIRSFQTFTIIFSLCEIVTVFIVFNSQALGHFGYILDLVIILYQTHCEFEGYGKFCRLLNSLRLWRLFRLFSSMVLVEKLLHQETQYALELAEELLKRSKSDAAVVGEELTKETEARRSVEEMLQSYKDEVDTLNEALKIAAMDIAEVAQTDAVDDDLDYLNDEDEEEDDDDEGRSVGAANSVSSGSASKKSTGFEDAVASKYGRNNNKSAIMRAVMDDNLRRAAVGNNGQSHSTTSHNGAFVVHENGTFEKR